jgi:uncharacterized membrane protein
MADDGMVLALMESDGDNVSCIYPVHVAMNSITGIGQKKLGILWFSVISATVHLTFLMKQRFLNCVLWNPRVLQENTVQWQTNSFYSSP